jgi:hypothetical protein
MRLKLHDVRHPERGEAITRHTENEFPHRFFPFPMESTRAIKAIGGNNTPSVKGSTPLEKDVVGLEIKVPIAESADDGEVQRPIPDPNVAVVAAVETVVLVCPKPNIMMTSLEQSR